MSETKFTKGNWPVEYDNCDRGSCEWYCVGPAKVEFSYRSTKLEEAEALANANLIAAAPEMYEILEYISENPSETNVIAIRKLLAKARGEE